MRKPTICLVENKDADSFAVTAPRISLLDQGRRRLLKETSKTFYECRRHMGEHKRGHSFSRKCVWGVCVCGCVCVWGGGF